MHSSEPNPFQPPRPITPEMIEAAEGGSFDPLLSFRSGRALTRATIFLIALVMVTDIMHLYSAWIGLDYCERTAHGFPPRQHEYMVYIWIRLGIAFIAALCTIGSAICFLIWMHQAYFNLEPLQAKVRRFTPGWAIVSWFLPILNFYRPYQAMVDIWHGSDPHALESPARRSWWLIVPTWWILWLSKTVFSLYVFHQSINVGTLDIMIEASYNQIVLSIVSIAAAIVTILMVWWIGLNQRLRYLKLSTASVATNS